LFISQLQIVAAVETNVLIFVDEIFRCVEEIIYKLRTAFKHSDLSKCTRVELFYNLSRRTFLMVSFDEPHPYYSLYI